MTNHIAHKRLAILRKEKKNPLKSLPSINNIILKI